MSKEKTKTTWGEILGTLVVVGGLVAFNTGIISTEDVKKFFADPEPEVASPTTSETQPSAPMPRPSTKASTSNDIAQQNSKRLREKLPKFAEAVEAYTLALQQSANSADSIIQQVTDFANSPSTRQATAANPAASQKNINRVCSECYKAFLSQAIKNRDILSEAQADSKYLGARLYIQLQPEGDIKTVLNRIYDNCEKARLKLGRATVGKSDVADQMRYLNEIRSEFRTLADEMEAEKDLIRATIDNPNW